jgi:hypothetical protein
LASQRRSDRKAATVHEDLNVVRRSFAKRRLRMTDVTESWRSFGV